MSVDEKSWVLALAHFLRSQHQLEAVLLDPDEQTIQVATLGKPDMEALQRQLAETLARVEDYAQSAHLLASSGLIVKQMGRKTLLEKPSCQTAPRFWTWRELTWPKAQEAESGDEWRLLAWLSAACGFFGLLGFATPYVPGLPGWWGTAFYVVAMFFGGWDALLDVFKKLPKGQFDIHFLMLAVAVGASSIGAVGEGALLLFLFSFSGALEHFALFRTHKEIKSLFSIAPKEALCLGSDGKEVRVPVDAIQVGDTLVVKPGDLFALDAEVVWGKTAADESTLTGEAHPVEKEIGSPVFGGTLNLWGSVRAKVLRPASQSALQRIITLIQEAQHLRAPIQRFTDRFGTRYTFIILGLTAAIFLFWLVMGVAAFTNKPGIYSAFYRAMTFLVVSSPCALVLSIPSAILAAIAWGARHGILFRGGAAIERLAQVNIIALDKTGTLTTGELAVESVESFPQGHEEAVLQLAYAIEQHAHHPLARAIVAHAKKLGIEACSGIENIKALTGMGIQADSAQGRCLIGRRELLSLGPLESWVKALPEPPTAYSEAWIVQGALLGRILLKDQVRNESRLVLEALRRMKIRTLMLTGDHRQTAEAVGRRLGITEVRSQLKPEDKVAVIDELTKAGHRVAMVGDGVNDAPCLAASYVAIGMGARGSDAALEQSDIVLMHDRIENVLDALALSRQARRVIFQNLTIALGTLVLMALGSLSGKVPISLGVIAHEGSTTLVCLNSLRLLFFRSRT